MIVPDESTAQAAREHLAVACESFQHQLRGLLDAKGKVADEVHAIRKLGKSLRGGLALFGLRKSAARLIQAVNRLLSAPRDAVSRAKTWTHLAWDADPLVAAAIAGLLDQQTHSASRRPPPATVDWCLAQVDAARAELLAVPDATLGATVAAGIAKLERRTLKRCRKLDRRAEADFHEARKALKAWLGALGFLPEATAPANLSQLDHLGERLGDENDLATLATWLASHGFSAQLVPDLWRTLHRSRLRLQRRAIKDAAWLKGADGR